MQYRKNILYKNYNIFLKTLAEPKRLSIYKLNNEFFLVPIIVNILGILLIADSSSNIIF